MSTFFSQAPHDIFQALSDIFGVIGHVWFFVFPPALYFVFKFLWMDYIQDQYIGNIKTVLLEIIPPRNVEKSPKVMETIFDGIAGVDKSPTTVESFVQGYLPPFISFELTGDGATGSHLYVRTPASFRNLIEAYFYAQYADVEILEVPDYVEEIPKGAPNKEWDLFGADVEFTKPDPYPIKTYHYYEEDVTGKMIDPLAGLLESFGKLPLGQKLWFQIIITPLRPDYYNTGKALLNEIIGRTPKVKPTTLLGDITSGIGTMVSAIPKAIAGEPIDLSSAEVKPEKKDFLEYQLTPIEKEVVKALEANIGRNVFGCRLRVLYLGKKKGFDRSFISAFFGGLKQFNDFNLNGFKPNDASKTYANYLFTQSRLRYRQRKILRRYKFRDPDSPVPMLALSTAELATLFHIPDMNVVAPSLTRVAAKRGSAPSNLPLQ
ncbi:MAG: hypothetical protein IPL87_03360 [Candidatus Moraniibacteriota bacterium]|nr:MAG: hypothetical protein IPL87_03360 [Candidatus Moranbacteria bacterium]